MASCRHSLEVGGGRQVKFTALGSRTADLVAIGLAAWLGTSACTGIAAQAGDFVEPPIEIYSRVAAGALRCWFGSQGSLKKTHVFHADVPPGEGSAAEIVLHERDNSGDNPRSVRAYRIRITSTGAGSRVEAENFRMPEAVARDLAADTLRWAGGTKNCSVIGIGGWSAEAKKGEPEPELATKKKKKK